MWVSAKHGNADVKIWINIFYTSLMNHSLEKYKNYWKSTIISPQITIDAFECNHLMEKLSMII
jgi:hypothetical protein